MKKSITCVLALLAVFTLVGRMTPLYAGGDKEPAAGQKVAMRVLDPTWDPMQKLWQEKIIPQFESANPNVSIQYEWVEWGPQLREKSVLAHTSGAPYDVFMIPDGYLPGLAKLGVAAPVVPKYFGASSIKEIKDRYIAGSLDMFVTYQAKLYAIPVEMSSHVFIYNPKHYEEIGRGAANPPKTFEEMLEIAKKLTKRDASNALVRSGFYPNVYPGSYSGFMMVAPQVYQLGGRYFDQTWSKPSFNSPECVKAYEVFKSIFDPKRVGSAQLGFAIDENQMGADFVSGRISQIYGAAYMKSVFTGIDANYNDYVYAPVPQLKEAKSKAVAVWGAIYCVDSASKSQGVAWKLVNYMSEEQFASTWMLDCGMYTGLKGSWLDEVLKKEPQYKVMFDAIQYGRPVLQTDHNDQFETALTEHMDRIISMGMDVKQSLDLLQKEAERIMSEK